MKTSKKTTGMLKIAALLPLLGLGLTGCGGGGGGNNNAAAYTSALGYGNCVGCGNGSSTLGTAVADIAQPGAPGTLGIDMELQFYSPTPGYNVPGSGYINQQNYSGQIGAAGFLNVYYSPALGCPIQPGRYQIQTSQAGTLQGNSIYALIMSGGGNGLSLNVAIANAFVNPAPQPVTSPSDGMLFYNKVYGRVQIMPSTPCQALDLNGNLQNYYENYAQ